MLVNSLLKLPTNPCSKLVTTEVTEPLGRKLFMFRTWKNKTVLSSLSARKLTDVVTSLWASNCVV